MSIELLPTFKTSAIVDVYNILAAPGNQLKDWSKSKTELVARIMKMGTEADIEKAIAVTESGPKPGTKGKVVKTKKPAKAKKEPKAKAAKSDKPKAQGVGAYAKEMILANPEMKAKEIVDLVQAKFPDCGCSHKSIGFYRHAMKKAGELK